MRVRATSYTSNVTQLLILSRIFSIKHFWYKQLIDAKFTILKFQKRLVSRTISLINSHYKLIDTTLNAYAQNTTIATQTPSPRPQTNQTATDPQQIKNYLNQAIQALDSGNNTKALEQVDLAEDHLESITGTESAEDDDDEEEEEGEIEEGPGEDEDETRDIDNNDEDTP
jgi:hypothetical protein